MHREQDHDSVIEIRGLSKKFADFRAVNQVDLRVRRGHIHALIGPNGAGKTTCFNLLTKMLEPTEGSIWFKGRDITRSSPAQVAQMGMVRSFQISAIFATLTVLDNVRVALQRPNRTSFKFWRSERILASLDERAHALLRDVGLQDEAATIAGDLSYGRKRALEIATTLALDPEMLLLDEPTSGMGLEDVRSTAALIRRISAKRTILMVEHNLGVVAELADRITVLAGGEVLTEGSYQEVSQDPRVMAAYIGRRKE
ncbi:MAG: ABC transporter ATP-binding protein [Pseudomonadota bacterium]